MIAPLLFALMTGAAPAHPNDDDARALKALQILGADVDGSSGRCASCHSLNIYSLNKWMRETQIAQWYCFWEPNGNDGDVPGRSTPPTPLERVNCMRTDASNPESPFDPRKLGIYAAGAHLPYFRDLFKAAYPESEWQQRYDGFRAAVQMPAHGEDLLTQQDYDHVLGWTTDGMPKLEELLGHPGDAPRECKAEIKPELVAHVRRMQTEGWEAKDREAGLTMFGCGPGQVKRQCFTAKDPAGNDLFPETAATEFGRAWAADLPEARLRILRAIPFETSYWMRSSADGRFFGNGARVENGGDDEPYWGGMISDLLPSLTAGATPRDIKVQAAFDPGFFPDNSGFIFQGTKKGAGFCPTSILENAATTQITFEEPECSSASDIDLYQAVGASLDGSDYLAVAGQFEGDGGEGHAGGDGQPSWMAKSYLQVTPIVNEGRRFKALKPTELWTPYLGDWGLSPSNLVTSSRVAGLAGENELRQQGYKFHFLDRKPTSTGYEVTLREAGTVCVKGGKGAFSYDERWFAIFHYVEADDWQELGYPSAEDPAFKQLLEKGSANVYVVDLATGASRRVTRMGAGQFALFPHFRADGWLYFQALDSKLDQRWAVASDAALVLAAAQGAP